jgi:hypothetical protein
MISLKKDPTNRVGQRFLTRNGIVARIIAYNANRQYPYIVEIASNISGAVYQFYYSAQLTMMFDRTCQLDLITYYEAI